jgi:hypothetical protein
LQVQLTCYQVPLLSHDLELWCCVAVNPRLGELEVEKI